MRIVHHLSTWAYYAHTSDRHRETGAYWPKFTPTDDRRHVSVVFALALLFAVALLSSLNCVERLQHVDQARLAA